LLQEGFPTTSSRTLQHGGGGEKSALVSGYFKFENGEAKNFLAPLPPLIHIRAQGAAISALNALWSLKLSVMLWGCPCRKFRLVEEEPIR
jgi:hypothetical protein